jgi:hypothetical protein
MAGRVRGAFFSTRLRRLPLTARRAARVLSHKGRAGSLLHRLGHKACDLLAATRQRPGFGGSGAPKSANLWLRIRCRTRRAPLGAPHAALVGSGPCFTLPAQCRSISQLLAGIHSDPGGSPEPPGRLGLRTRPAGAAPHPAFTTPRDSAPQRMRWPESSAGAARGDNSSRHTGESRYPARAGRRKEELNAPTEARSAFFVLARSAPLDSGFRRNDGLGASACHSRASGNPVRRALAVIWPPSPTPRTTGCPPSRA